MKQNADNTAQVPLLLPGLVSVTFRQLAPRRIVALCRQANLTAIEWGGDVHVQPGDIAGAVEIGGMTRDAGLSVAAYGSYYRAGAGGGPSFETIRDTAAALGAPLIRVWAGDRGSPEADAGYRARVAEDLRRICALSGASGIRVACEYHGGTLTDTAESTLSLLRAVDHPNLATFWQPRAADADDAQIADLEALLPWLASVHVFYWPNGRRAALREGEAAWLRRLAVLQAARQPRALLLEFVREDSPEQLLADAAALHHWLARLAASKK